jgi:predicted DNA-binding antitoxin AbrB/MazE fold protein
MIQVIAATYQDGVFRPDQQPALSESTRVRLIVETGSEETDETLQQCAWASLEQLWRASTFDSRGDRLSRDQLHERR